MIQACKNRQKITQKHWYLSYWIHPKESISDCENINSANPLNLIIGDVDGYIEKSNGNKYLTFSSTDNNQKVLEKYTKLSDEIKYHIQTINASKSGEYDKYYTKISSDDGFPLNKIVKFHVLTIIVRSVLKKMVNTTHKFS